MDIGKISAARTFNGLLDANIKYSHTKLLYNGKHTRDYFVQEYHPFAEESLTEVKRNISALKKENNRNEIKNARKSSKGSYVTVKLGSVLDMTKKECSELIEAKLRQFKNMIDKDIIKSVV